MQWQNFPFIYLILIMGLGECLAQYKYYKEVNGWLRLHVVPATWWDARLRCHLEGGSLASPTTSSLTTALMVVMAEHKLTTSSIFTGIHATISKGDFMTMNGIPLSNISLHWASGEPNNLDNAEDCLVMNGAGEAADASCGSLHPYFCYRNQNIFNECGNTDNNYVFEPRTGNCYKIHREARSWHRAAMTCIAEGAHLAVLESNLESEVLRELMAKHLDGVDTHNVHVGVWDWNEHREWLTIFGETCAKAGFDTWKHNEPNKSAGSEQCGSIDRRDGLLNELSCDIKAPFICEVTQPYLRNYLD